MKGGLWLISAAVVVLLCSGAAFGQTRGSAMPVPTRKPFDRVPATLARHAAALGDRTQAAGQELVTYTGEFVVALTGNRSRVQVMYQPPGFVRLEGFDRTGVVSFDGTRASGVSTGLDEKLLETFLMDAVEGMLSSVQNGAGMRYIGGRFRPVNGRGGLTPGPRYDIFEVTALLAWKSNPPLRLKMFYFDSATGLLQRTRYDDRSVARPPKVETRFSQWQNVNGSLYAGRIERYEDGQPVFTLTVTNVASGPAVDAAKFR